MQEKWNNQVYIQNENVILRCIDESFGPSKSSGNPMITLNWEVASPDTINVGGVDYEIKGLKVSPSYHTTKNLTDSEKSEKNDKSTFGPSGNKDNLSLWELFELDPTGVDKENPPLAFKGKLMHARINGDPREVTKAPTAEQLKKGQRTGDVVINPKTKKPEVTYYPKIVKMYGLAEEVVGAGSL